MSKDYFVSYILERSGLESKKVAETTFDAIVSSLREGLIEDGSVQLRNFGNFVVAERAQRTGRHPRTGESIVIPGARTVRFQAGAELKQTASVAVTAATGEVDERRGDFMKTMDAQLEDWKRRVGDYRVQYEKLGDGARKSYKDNMDKLAQSYEDARYKLTLLKGGSSGAWTELKQGFDAAFGDLKKAFKRAMDKF